MYSLPYLIIFSFLLLLSFPVCKTNLYNYNFIKFDVKVKKYLSFFVLLIFLGFRGYIYSDVFSYHRFFEKIPFLLDKDIDFSKYLKLNGWEKGYLIYAFLLKQISYNYIFWQFFSTLIDLLLLTIVINIYLPDNRHSFCYLLYFVFYGFLIEVNLLRNVKAIMLFLISLQYINKSFKKYILINILAALFHISALVYIPLYFVLNKKFNRNIILLLFILGNFIEIFHIPLLSFLIKTVLSKTAFINLFDIYLNSDLYSASKTIGFGWLERNVSFILVFLFSKKLDKKESNIFLNIFYIYIFLSLFLSEIKIFADRVPYLFAMGYWFIFPIIYSNVSKRNKKIILIYMFFIALVKTYMLGTDILCKYKFIFFDDYEYRHNIFNKTIDSLLLLN